MALMAVLHSNDISREQYDALRPRVQWEKNHPEGLMFHTCAFDPQGAMHVTDIWESQEQMQAFFQGRLLPVMQELNIAPPQPQIFPAHNVDAFPGLEKHQP